MSAAPASGESKYRPRRVKGRWFCYLLECADGTLYTGITTSVSRRLTMHNRGRASKYTRGRLPVRLVYVERHSNRSSASRRESQVKRMSRAGKRALGSLSASGEGQLRAST
ncbi:MAG TPA: GIY-YIG nuclease family protein [Methylomirabilota bacterium]|nr:GIY-YIG nuclease family protein [Methylomirabilota bacterium]